MRIDLYTKTILTLIVLLLAVIACKPLILPSSVNAQASLAGVQFVQQGTYAVFAIDTHSGDIWSYVLPEEGVSQARVEYMGKITQVGKPLVQK